MKYLYLLFMLFSLLACQNNPNPKGLYSLDECKKELLTAKDFHHEGRIDLIVIEKKQRKMYLYYKQKLQNTLPISLGKNPIGTKIQRGDNRTPEGVFWISRKLCSPKYYRSLCISYPRPQDKARARKQGLDAGGNITIHAQPKWNASGHGNAYTLSKDWTQGCVAITNDAMKNLWYAVHKGVPIVIR